MNLDNFPFNELLEEEKEEKENRKLPLLKKLLLLMYGRESEGGRENQEIIKDIEQVMSVYQSVGELEGYVITSFKSKAIMGLLRWWILVRRKGTRYGNGIGYGDIITIEIMGKKDRGSSRVKVDIQTSNGTPISKEYVICHDGGYTVID